MEGPSREGSRPIRKKKKRRLGPILFLLALLGLGALVFFTGGGEGEEGGGVGQWMRKNRVRRSGIQAGEAEKFARDFGISDELAKDLQDRLTNGGKAGPEEMEERLYGFMLHVQARKALFLADPAQGVREALKDPEAFKRVKAPPGPGAR